MKRAFCFRVLIIFASSAIPFRLAQARRNRRSPTLPPGPVSIRPAGSIRIWNLPIRARHRRPLSMQSGTGIDIPPNQDACVNQRQEGKEIGSASVTRCVAWSVFVELHACLCGAFWPPAIVPGDRHRIPTRFSDHAAVNGIAAPVNAGVLLEGFGFVGSHCCPSRRDKLRRDAIANRGRHEA